MTGALLRNRLRVILNHFRALEPSERVRLVLIVVLLAFVLSRWSGGLLQRSLDMAPSDVPGAVRIVAYRIGAFLAAIVGFTSFGVLWRSPDTEVLNRLPLPPAAIFSYRLVLTLIGDLPFLLLALTAFVPLLWHGFPRLALEAAVYLSIVFVLTTICGLWWHMFAGFSVVTPAYAMLKQRLAGAMVLPDRTLLLYSPVLAAVSGFGLGLLALTGMSAIGHGETLMGGLELTIACVPGVVAYFRARALFASAYYQALAALADGELLGELGESAPGAGFLGAWYVEKLPARLRPLVARDLRQAWRRNRLDHVALLVGSITLAVVALGRGPLLQERGWLWPLIWGVLAAAAGEGFRLTRPSSDAPWLWLTLPVAPRDQYAGRLLATLFFSLMVTPGLVLTAVWSGVPVGIALAAIALFGVGSAVVSVNLALVLFTQRRLAGILFLTTVALALLASREDPLWAAGILAILAGSSLGLLRQLPSRLATATDAR